mgnify:CR=1 FL=1
MIDPKFYEDRMKRIQRKIWFFSFIVAISVLSFFGLLISTKYEIFNAFIICFGIWMLLGIILFTCVEISYLNSVYEFESEKFLSAVSALGLSYDEYYNRGKTLKPSKEFRKLKIF